jgi:nitronate monooxygenase
MLRTRLTSAFHLRHPIVSAPMIQASDARLAAAVTAAGGLGLIGAAYGDRRWLARELKRAANTRVGCGFITWSLARDPGLLEMVLQHQPAAIFLSFGDPVRFADHVRACGIPLMCQISTLAQAHQAIDAGADVLVAQGNEAGGHSTGARSTFTLVPDVVDLATTRAPQTLVLAAGGVVDGRTLAAALALGADGALVGTRLWASTEAAVAPAAHARALAATGDDTLRTSVYDIVRDYPWPAPYTARVLRNDFLDQWQDHEYELRANITQARHTYQRATAHDDFDGAPIIAGEAVGQVNEVLPVATILERMASDAHTVLNGDRIRRG